MYQCILNVPLWNDWSKVTYSQVHGSPVLKTLLLQSFWWISATRFAELIQFWQDPKCRRNRTFWRKNWRKISYFVFIYIFPLVLLLIIYVCVYIYIYICIYIQIARIWGWNQNIWRKVTFSVRSSTFMIASLLPIFVSTEPSRTTLSIDRSEPRFEGHTGAKVRKNFKNDENFVAFLLIFGKSYLKLFCLDQENEKRDT